MTRDWFFKRKIIIFSPLGNKLILALLMLVLFVPISITNVNAELKDLGRIDCEVIEEGTKYYTMRCCDIAYDTEYDIEVPVGCTEYSCEKGGECIEEEEQFKRHSFGEIFPPDEDVIKGSEEQDNGSSSVFDRDELLSEKKVDENILDEKSVIQEQPLEREATLNDRGIFISTINSSSNN